MKIVFEPQTNQTNMYVSILVNGLRICGFEIYSLKQYLSDFSLRPEIRIVHLNWYENISGHGFVRVYLKYLKQSIKLRIIKASGSKIIWTMHNQQPHNSSYLRLKKRLLKHIVEVSDAIIVHSQISYDILKQVYSINENKIFYIAHPNYMNLYGGDTPVSKVQLNSLKVLFLGAVKRYKNIELLLEVAKTFNNSQIVLTIAGNPESDSYAKIIKELASNIQNVNLHLEFVHDEDVGTFLLESDVVVTPYENGSILNSGSIYLALSYGKTVISPKIGTTIDIIKQGGEDLIFSYEYQDENEHKKKLVQILKGLIRNIDRDPDFLNVRREAALNYMQKYHNNREIANDLSKIYFSVLETRHI